MIEYVGGPNGDGTITVWVNHGPSELRSIRGTPGDVFRTWRLVWNQAGLARPIHEIHQHTSRLGLPRDIFDFPTNATFPNGDTAWERASSILTAIQGGAWA